MAAPDIVRGTYISIMVGDGVTPTEGFTAICGVTAKSFTHQANTQDEFTRDCDDPEDIPTRRVIVTGEQWDLNASGQHNRAQRALIEAAVGVSKNYRFVIGEPAGDAVDDGYYQGAAVMTNRTIGGDDGAMASIEVTLASDGAWVWADAV